MKVIPFCLYQNSEIINKLTENKLCWQTILGGSLFEVFFFLQSISQSLRALQTTQLF